MSIPLLKQGVWIPQSLDCRLLDDANLMRPRQGRGGHIWDSHIQESNAVQRIRSMPDYVVSSEKGLKLVEVKFRKISEHGGQPGVYLKNSDLNRYRKYWDESMIALISPYGDRFFCQEVRELIPGTMETKWFDYASFQRLPQMYPATSDKLKAFGVAVDKLGSLWDEQKGHP